MSRRDGQDLLLNLSDADAQPAKQIAPRSTYSRIAIERLEPGPAVRIIVLQSVFPISLTESCSPHSYRGRRR